MPTNVAPKIQFAYNIKDELKINVNGEEHTYQTEIDWDKTSFTRDGYEVDYEVISIPYDSTFVTFKPTEMLWENDTFQIQVTVNIFKNGIPLDSQTKTETFVTGGKLEIIPDGNIAASYPIDGMSHFYLKENDGKGFIVLDSGQPELLRDDIYSDTIVVVRFCDADFNCFETPSDYHAPENRLDFNIPIDQFQKEKHYRGEVVRKSKDDDSTTGGQIVADFYFRTSAFITLSEKLIFNQNKDHLTSGNSSITRDVPLASFTYYYIDNGIESFDRIELDHLVKMKYQDVSNGGTLLNFATAQVPQSYPDLAIGGLSLSTIGNQYILNDPTTVIDQDAFESEIYEAIPLQAFGTTYFQYLSNLSELVNGGINELEQRLNLDGIDKNDEEKMISVLGASFYTKYKGLTAPQSPYSYMDVQYILQTGKVTTDSKSTAPDKVEVKNTSDIGSFLSIFN